MRKKLKRQSDFSNYFLLEMGAQIKDDDNWDVKKVQQRRRDGVRSWRKTEEEKVGEVRWGQSGLIMRIPAGV